MHTFSLSIVMPIEATSAFKMVVERPSTDFTNFNSFCWFARSPVVRRQPFSSHFRTANISLHVAGNSWIIKLANFRRRWPPVPGLLFNASLTRHRHAPIFSAIFATVHLFVPWPAGGVCLCKISRKSFIVYKNHNPSSGTFRGKFDF